MCESEFAAGPHQSLVYHGTLAVPLARAAYAGPAYCSAAVPGQHSTQYNLPASGTAQPPIAEGS